LTGQKKKKKKKKIAISNTKIATFFQFFFCCRFENWSSCSRLQKARAAMSSPDTTPAGEPEEQEEYHPG